MNRKQRRAKAKETKKEYNPLENSNDQPFKEHMLHMKEAHDIGQLLWLLNSGRLVLPHHNHNEGAINKKLPFNIVEENYYKTKPNIVVIDDFMNLEALQKLKDYCLEFPFWNTIYGRGYLGAFRQNGFNPQVLETLALEMVQNLPKIFNTTNKRNLAQMWAFKYESKCPGIDVHADFAAVNVNFWITPTEANRDYDKEKDIGKTGGMWIWDAGAPVDWDFNRYNGDNKDEVLEYLDKQQSKAVYIPYKYNRCVLFNSNLFHKTADVNFLPGFDNKRINVTMLFGQRENSGVEPQDMIEAAKLRESTSVPVLDNMNLETGEIDTTLQEVA
tara:strand:- start:2627 stop:3613 length:987 start_codon:yes stop_codon:yes gene_type:complete